MVLHHRKEISYWEKTSILAPYDCVIVGAGLTGLHTALQFRHKFKDSRIAVLERSAFSSGASTRNAGFACFGNVSEILDDLRTMSEEETYQLMDQRYRGLQKTRELLGDLQIGYQAKGSHEILSDNIKNTLADYLPEANRKMKQYLGLDEVFRLKTEDFGFSNAAGSISNAYEGQLHTGKLYQALRGLAQNQCIEILGGCEVVHWEKMGSNLEVVLKDGISMSTGVLILATNAFTPQLIPGEDIVPARGQVIVSEKIPGVHLNGIFNFDAGYYYWRDLDGRILLGGARNMDVAGETTDQFGSHESIRTHLKKFLEEKILQKPVNIEMEWSGIMAMGSQKKPLIRKVEPQVYLAARMGGMGVALSAVVAEEIVSMV